jgi:hypothetical protein
VLIPVHLIGEPLGGWPLDINRRVGVFAGNLDPSDRERIIPWTDGEWRTYVIAPVEKWAASWRKWLHGLRPTPNARQGDGAAAGQPMLATTPKSFTGGAMVFFADRVELCGVDICSGPRSIRRRAVLDLLRLRRGDSFVAYSGEKLAMKAGLKNGQTGAAGLVRDIRNRISKALLQHADIECGEEDVILSGGPGYRFSNRLSVHDGQGSQSGPTTDTSIRIDVPIGPDADVANVSDGTDDTDDTDDTNDPVDTDVPIVADEATQIRRAWILDQLALNNRLQAPAIETQFGCSKSTAKRDLKALTDQGKIEFVGAARTGYYRLRSALADAHNSRG